MVHALRTATMEWGRKRGGWTLDEFRAFLAQTPFVAALERDARFSIRSVEMSLQASAQKCEEVNGTDEHIPTPLSETVLA